IPHRLREVPSDIVYRCEIDGRTAYILFLIEHQSRPDRWLPFRQLQYKVGLMDQHLQQGGDTLPLILTLCLYHGKKSPYPYSVELFDLFKDPALARKYLLYCGLIDLTVMSDEALQQHGVAALTECLFKHIFARDFVQALKQLIQQGIFAQTLDPLGPPYL